MDPELYYGLVRYLANGNIPVGLAKETQWMIKKISNHFEVQRTILYRIDRDIKRIVATPQERSKILKLTHDDPLGGHQGQQNTFEQISRTHYWPEMRKDVRNYVRTCDLRQKRNKDRATASLERLFGSHNSSSTSGST